MKNKQITFKKKNFTILVICLNQIKFDFFKNFLYQQIQESPSFFKNIPVVLNIENLFYSLDWIHVKNFILSVGLFLIGIIGCKDKNLKKIILQSGIPILSESKIIISKLYKNFNSDQYNKKSIHLSLSQISSYQSDIIDSIIRSGQRVYSPYNDLIITNNVSSGAELISGGNVHIYGVMRGRVLAGVNGDVTRKIFCTSLFAELIAIAGEYLTIEQIPIKFLGKSVEISLIKKILFIKNLK
ncbi:Septum site-determining protein MinC [Buchnera aphidicola (Cinara kochiana kochiana)]|uniref:Probable septum site-determining protein MinC n=1 Tax=Buchnera aphidicola (Cinara kochiana kochiana) TaxID=2518976 RepID=A0A451D5K4_9GAMM|nr:septum site-determining protein MinC [Buchnera aphidicola]VFP81129.1 Septum site-determining protein MinC [Buchnera aphidicola (Cinara kochiana kochiana)]